jgi:hypothetical protein
LRFLRRRNSALPRRCNNNNLNKKYKYGQDINETAAVLNEMNNKWPKGCIPEKNIY